MNPEKTRKLITVVCACIRRNGGKQVLMSIRHAPGVPGLDGKWELPGGKIEFGETPDQAVVREIREEIGIEVEPLRLLPYLHTNVWEYEHSVHQIVLAAYDCQVRSGGLSENSDVRWFDVESIDFGETLPGTREFVGLALKSDWFDKLWIQLERVDPTTNVTRQFVVAAQPSLFSQYGVMKYWVRSGHYVRVRHEDFDSPRQMDDRIFEMVKGRLTEGYRITGLEGPVQRYEVLGKVVGLTQTSLENTRVH